MRTTFGLLEKPTFADVIRGAGVSSSVRVLKQSNVDTGQREVLALQSDIDDPLLCGLHQPCADSHVAIRHRDIPPKDQDARSLR